MCKIDFSTTFLNKSFPHWLYDVIFVYGDAIYAVISFLQHKRNNTRFTRLHRGVRTMDMIDIIVFSIQPLKHISMSRSVFSYETTMYDRTVRMFLPRTKRGRSSSIAHRVVNIHKMISRIEQVIHSVPFHNRRSFHYWCGLVIRSLFPRLRAVHTLFQRFRFDASLLHVKLGYPKVISFIKTNMIQVVFPIIILKQE